jgi:hypothetical protein
MVEAWQSAGPPSVLEGNMFTRSFLPAMAILALAAASLPAQSTRGVVRGVVSIRGSDEVSQVPVSQHQDVCGESVPDRHLVVNNGRVANALVVLEYQGRADFARTVVTLRNDECDFQPTVQVAPPGATLILRNDDPIPHTMRLEQNGVASIVQLQPDRQRKQDDLLTDTGLLEIQCEAHEWMYAKVWVLAHPYYAITEPDGSFAIGLIPSGTYRLKVWHEQLGVLEREIVIRGNETVAASFAFER